MIILNTSTKITPENILEFLTQQNSEVATVRKYIIPKFCYTTKKGTRSIVIKFNSEIPKRLLHKRVKLGWTLQGS
jgi:hypothetical protein